MNSIYGALANNYCFLADVDAARSITETGQWVGQEAGNLGDKYAKETFDIDKSIVIAGDTDSVGKDTIIRSSMGQKQIQDLWTENVNDISFTTNNHEIKYTDGLKILTYRDGKVSYEKTKRIIRHKVSKKRYKLTVNGKSVVITEDHCLVILRNGKFVRVSPKNIEKLDKIMCMGGRLYNKSRRCYTSRC